MVQPRDKGSGRFSSKSDELRSVRSFRATNEVWEKLGELAELRGITRSDLIEMLVNDEKIIGVIRGDSQSNVAVDFPNENELKLMQNQSLATLGVGSQSSAHKSAKRVLVDFTVRLSRRIREGQPPPL